MTKHIVVTGANSGIGFEALNWLLSLDCTVILACRNLKKAQKAMQNALKRNPKGKMEIIQIDLGNMN